MVLDIYETREDDSEEPADPNQVRAALSWVLDSQGTIDYEDGPWTVDLDGENGLEFSDEESDSTAYLPSGASGDIMGGGGDETATFVTIDDESTDLENSQQHANLSGADLHDPAVHDNTTHAQAFVADGDGTERQIWIIANGASDPAGAGPEDLIFEEES